MTVCLQYPVLEATDVSTLKRWLEGLSRDNFFYEHNNGRWGLRKVQPLSHRYINPHDSWFPVSFDYDGHVITESITEPFACYPENETLKKTVSIALSVMARHGNWQSQTCQMAMSIMQHHSLKIEETTKAIPWHRDASDDTLVILLDDQSQWAGGDFLFQEAEAPVKRLQPKCGYGIFFSNEGTRHSVEPLTVNTEGMNRTILSLHQKSRT
jgi:hypothetical protein